MDSTTKLTSFSNKTSNYVMNRRFLAYWITLLRVPRCYDYFTIRWDGNKCSHSWYTYNRYTYNGSYVCLINTKLFAIIIITAYLNNSHILSCSKSTYHALFTPNSTISLNNKCSIITYNKNTHPLQVNSFKVEYLTRIRFNRLRTKFWDPGITVPTEKLEYWNARVVWIFKYGSFCNRI